MMGSPGMAHHTRQDMWCEMILLTHLIKNLTDLCVKASVCEDLVGLTCIQNIGYTEKTHCEV